MLKKIVAAFVFVLLFSCDDDVVIDVSHEWVITQWRVKTTSTCHFGSDEPEPKLNTVISALFSMELNNYPVSVVLSGNQFEIRNDGKAVLRGTTFYEKEHLVFQSQADSIHIKQLHQSKDSLIWYTRGTDSLREIVVKLYPKR
jgi:hypothetical protein